MNRLFAPFAVMLLLLFYTPSLKAQTEDVDFDIASDTTVILTDTLQLHHQDTIVQDIAIQDTIALTDTSPQNIHDPILTVSPKTTPVVSPDNVANPHWATLWALFPGGGQVYNWHYGDKWWIASLKLTAIYGGFGTLTYFIIRNTNDYRDFRNAYKWISSKHESGKENKYTDGSYTEDQLKSYMNYYQANMEWCYFFTGLLYGLQIVEATVTAHLLTFDVSDNLSFSVRPLYLPDFSASPALSLSLRYKIQ